MSTKRMSNLQVAVAYLRVSTDKQDLSPEAQRASIEAWAAREHVTIADWRTDTDVCSETEMEYREGLMQAIGLLRPCGASILLVAKRDRLARDTYVVATIERALRKLKARVVSADGAGNGETPADRFMQHILDAAAEYELAQIRSRTKAALQAKRARGERAGELPYGYRLAADGLHLEEDPAEQTVIAEVRRLRGSGLSLRAVVAEAGRMGLTSRSGRPFTLTQVARMVRSEAA